MLNCSSGERQQTDLSEQKETDSSISVGESNNTIDQNVKNTKEQDVADLEDIEPESFEAFVYLFHQSNVSIPDWASETFMDMEDRTNLSTEDLLESDPYYLLLYKKFMPVGPGLDQLYGTTYLKNGTQLSNIKLGESYPDAGPGGPGKDYSYTYDANRQVLEVTNKGIDWDDEAETETFSETFNYYYLDSDGTLIGARMYPEASNDYLRQGDLLSYSSDQLRLMRNEIFAMYGYIFKSAELKNHFSSMKWYEPLYDNVDDLLSDVEKANVQLIKQMEDMK